MGNWLCHSPPITLTSGLINTNNNATRASTSGGGGGEVAGGDQNDGSGNGERRQNDEEIQLKVYSFADMKSATRSFRRDWTLGVGGFGTVYKGWVNPSTLSPSKFGTGMMVAIKKLNKQSTQGFREWEVKHFFSTTNSLPF